jgi:hypothetical protein
MPGVMIAEACPWLWCWPPAKLSSMWVVRCSVSLGPQNPICYLRRLDLDLLSRQRKVLMKFGLVVCGIWCSMVSLSEASGSRALSAWCGASTWSSRRITSVDGDVRVAFLLGGIIRLIFSISQAWWASMLGFSHRCYESWTVNRK